MEERLSTLPRAYNLQRRGPKSRWTGLTKDVGTSVNGALEDVPSAQSRISMARLKAEVRHH